MKLFDSNNFKFTCMKWGYDNDFTSNRNRESIDSTWSIKYNPINRVPLSFRKECINAAKQIRDSSDLPIQILLSGGIDSMSVCESFRLAKIPFTPVICQFNDNLNYHDIKYAIEYCDTRNLKPILINLNVLKFWDEQIRDYAVPVQSRRPQTTVYNWITDQIDGLPILGAGEPWICIDEEHPQVKNPDGRIRTFEGEQYNYHQKWFIYRGRPGIGEFYKYTPELRVSGLIDEIYLNWYDIKESYDTDTYKKYLFNKHFPDVGTRPPIEYKRFYRDERDPERTILREDYTGFEYISDEHKKQLDKLVKLFPQEYNTLLFIPVMELLEEMCGHLEEMTPVLEKVRKSPGMLRKE